MEFSVLREPVFAALDRLRLAVNPRHAITIYQHILFTLHKDALELVANDTELQISTRVPVTSSVQGRFTAPALPLLEVFRTIRDETVKVIVNEKTVRFVGSQGRFSFSTLSVDDFFLLSPPTSSAEAIVTAGALKRAMEATVFTTVENDPRLYVRGILFDLFDDHIAAVATDTHRLSLADAPAKCQPQPDIQPIVPRKAAQALARIGDGEDEVTIMLSNTEVSARCGNTTVISTLLDAPFPVYKEYLPDHTGDHYIIVGREPMREALQAVLILDKRKSLTAVRLDISTEHILARVESIDGQDIAEFSILPEEVVLDNGAVQVEYNALHLEQALGAMHSERVRLAFFTTAGRSTCLLSGIDQIGDGRYMLAALVSDNPDTKNATKDD